jgi:membrane fusion protein
MTRLFRNEVVENKKESWLGHIRIIQPTSILIITGFIVLTVIAVILFLYIGQYTRKARVMGYLAPEQGVLRLWAPQAATVTQSHAREGRLVHRGEVLFVLSLDQATATGDAHANVGKTLVQRRRILSNEGQQHEQLHQSRAVALERERQDRQQELAQLELEIRLHQERLDLARQAQARLQALSQDRFVSAAQVQTQSEELLGLRAQLQGLERQRAAQLREIGTLQAQTRELPLLAQVQQAEIDRSLAELGQKTAENESLRQIVIRAPSDGTLGSVLAQTGYHVDPSAPLASLLPANAQLQAHLFAPSSAIGLMQAQQTVLLRFDAFPYQKFGAQAGSVLQVSRTPLQAAELATLPLPAAALSNEPLYRVSVRLAHQSLVAHSQRFELTSGMQLQADVLLERRRLMEWIFEPLMGMANRI